MVEYEILISHAAGVIERCSSLARSDEKERKMSKLPAWWMDTQTARLLIIHRMIEARASRRKIEPKHHGTTDAIRSKELAVQRGIQQLNAATPQTLVHDQTSFEIPDLRERRRHLESKGLYVFMDGVAYNLTLKAQRLPDWMTPLFQEYERPSFSQSSPVSIEAEDVQATEYQVEESPEESLAELESYLKLDPDAAVNTLVRLPPDLESLDLLTRMLTTHSTRDLLDLYGFQPWDIARQHLQHSLRYLENETSDDGSAIDVERSATLLTVYLRNILPRGFVDPSIVYMDIQELCTRYIWVPAVLEFRRWFYAAVNTTELTDNPGSSGTAGWTQMGG
jgi:hypothetical protein